MNFNEELGLSAQELLKAWKKGIYVKDSDGKISFIDAYNIRAECSCGGTLIMTLVEDSYETDSHREFDTRDYKKTWSINAKDLVE